MSTLTVERTIWVCVDCYFAHHGLGDGGYEEGERRAAGITLPDHDRELPRVPLSLIAEDADTEVTSGLPFEEHMCWVAADGETVVRWMLSGVPWQRLRVTKDGEVEYLRGECDCEEDTFSWSSCGGCGSPLGGSRHALTILRRTA